jgi:hypothetical protein
MLVESESALFDPSSLEPLDWVKDSSGDYTTTNHGANGRAPQNQRQPLVKNTARITGITEH